MEAEEASQLILSVQDEITIILRQLESDTGLNVGSIQIDRSQEAFDADDCHIEIQMYLMGA